MKKLVNPGTLKSDELCGEAATDDSSNNIKRDRTSEVSRSHNEMIRQQRSGERF